MENVYQTPNADLTLPEDRPAYARDQSPFFVTSTGKLALLYLVTMGTYSIYWFYKHWDTQNRLHDAKVMPAARSIFQIFFTHSLFSRIEDAYQAETGKPWNYSGMAWLYIIAGIISQALDKASARSDDFGLIDIVALAILPLTMLPLCVAQMHANIAARDPKGRSNSRISGLNMLFIIPGCLFWAFVLLGYAIMAGVVPDTALDGILNIIGNN